MDPLITEDPSHIGPYRLIARLGAGGMGLVYLGRSDVGRTVAVKVVQTAYAKDPEFRRRFANEVAAARRVGGAWTAAVLDADTEAQVPWVATQYVAGPSLQAVVAEDFGPLPEVSVCALASGLALALTEIHTAGLIHRDLKPGNVLVTVDGPRVIDFGIARALETLAEGPMTRTGAVIGSPGFMSPEQVRGQRLTPASDIFCLGSVLAYAATGRSPFGTTDSGLHALMFRVAEEEPDLAGVPESLLGLVQQCLQKDPALRPTAQDVARTATDSDEPWLPGRVLSQLGRHSAQLLDFAPLQTPDPTVISVPAPALLSPSAPTAAPTYQDPQPAWQTPAQTPPLPPAPSLHNAPTSTAHDPSAPTGPRRRRIVVAAASATALAVLVGGLFVIRPWDGGGEKKSNIVPAGFFGTWTGPFIDAEATAGDPLARLEITKGGRGDKVVEYSQLIDRHVCVYSGRLTSVSDTSPSIEIAAGTLERAEPKAAAEDCDKRQPAMSLVSLGGNIDLTTGEAETLTFKKDPLSDPESRLIDPFGGRRSPRDPDQIIHYDAFDMNLTGPGKNGIGIRTKEYGKTCRYVTEAFSLVEKWNDYKSEELRETTLHTAPSTLRADDTESDPGCRKDGPVLEITHLPGVDGKYVSVDVYNSPEGETLETDVRMDRSTD
ncbi:serine/threonine protein kinase [Streptomyces sp. WAC 01529]|uniref:serine/threonine protein kinase n=1 Tax=Streptomyces sp. WAC 01529 TaxID=2203205 RepID=UPI000F71BA17|nr:serine/threonine-protein kinase [Streptomyces sp. WAC 01529]AZM52687.1 serine/threonine protein kinase [Streptomyces sp. WAC 01529]